MPTFSAVLRFAATLCTKLELKIQFVRKFSYPSHLHLKFKANRKIVYSNRYPEEVIYFSGKLTGCN